MSTSSVKLRLAESTLKVIGDKESEILSPSHRIFFLNVVGFSPAESFSGYQARFEAARPQLLEEIVDYLKQQGFEVKYDRAVHELLGKLHADAGKLEEACSLGRRLKSSPVTSVKVPGLKRSLKPYQTPAIAHMIELPHVANFSVPGSGKTSIVLAAYAVLKKARKIDALIVIGPRSSFVPWEEEFRECFRRSPRITRIVGSRHARKRLYRKAETNELTILTYQMAANDAGDIFKLLKRRRIMLVIDESHNIKRLEGGKWANALLDLAPFAEKRVILSGTPVPNSLLDLWSQMTFLWPHPPILGSREHYKDRIGRKNDSVKSLQRELLPFYWRIHKSDLKLPKPRYHRIKVRMRPYQQAIYDAIAAKVLGDLVKVPEDRAKLRPWRRARMVRLLQSSCNPSLLAEYSEEFRIPPLGASGLAIDQLISHYSDYESPAKLVLCLNLVRKLVDKGHKVLVWTSFIHNIKTLATSFADLNPAIVYGGVPKDDTEDENFNREQMIKKFKTSETCRVLIANPAACGESVSLHKVCLHVIYLDRTFNGAQFMQSLDRTHRVGLDPDDRVHYYILQADNSIDAVIDSRLMEKQRRMLELLNDDFAILDLQSEADEISEELEEDRDFSEMIAHLKSLFGKRND